MAVYDFLINLYNNFIAAVPAPLQWLVTLLILIGLIGALFALVRQNVLAIIIVIILLPFLIPVLKDFLIQVVDFLQYLLQALKITAPQG